MAKDKKINKGSAGQNRKAGENYIEKYAQKKGVERSSSGLLYRVLESGSGKTPTEFDTVKVNQRILNVDGSVIADTYKTGLPDEFSMAEALPGLKEALQMMEEGARWEIVIPPDLAWGKKGVGNKIGPFATLVFDVRLLEVV